jgi:hypothetical protein
VAQLAALAAQLSAVLASAQETAAAAASVRVAAELHQRLADFDAAAAAGSYLEAAWIALELQKAVQAVPGSEETAAAVEARVQPLKQQLLEGIWSCWSIDPASRMPVLLPLLTEGADAAGGGHTASGDASAGTAGAAGTATQLAEAWKALRVLGLLEQALGQAAAFVLEHSVQPILASGALRPGLAGLWTSCSATPQGSQTTSTLVVLCWRFLPSNVVRTHCRARPLAHHRLSGRLGRKLQPEPRRGRWQWRRPRRRRLGGTPALQGAASADRAGELISQTYMSAAGYAYVDDALHDEEVERAPPLTCPVSLADVLAAGL